MGSSAMLHSLCFTTQLSPTCFNTPTLSFTRSQFVSSNSFLSLKNSTLRIKSPTTRTSGVVFAAQSSIFKALQTAWNVGKDGIEAGTSLVPASVPRPIARISVTIVALSVSLFVLKSFVSTVFFVLATMGLAYFVFIALKKDEGPKGQRALEAPPRHQRRMVWMEGTFCAVHFNLKRVSVLLYFSSVNSIVFQVQLTEKAYLTGIWLIGCNTIVRLENLIISIK